MTKTTQLDAGEKSAARRLAETFSAETLDSLITDAVRSGPRSTVRTVCSTSRLDRPEHGVRAFHRQSTSSCSGGPRRRRHRTHRGVAKSAATLSAAGSSACSMICSISRSRVDASKLIVEIHIDWCRAVTDSQ